MRTIEEYQEKIIEVGFEEFPYVIFGDEQALADFVEYDDADLDLKIYLSKVVMCRCFPATGGICFPSNADWFISNFIRTYDKDFVKPWLTGAIITATEMIINDTFTGIIGTTFMFGVVEFYAKHKLGFKPNEFDFFDDNKNSYIKELYSEERSVPQVLTIKKAFEFLQKRDLPISHLLNNIDKQNTKRLEEVGIIEERWIKAKIADRLSLARNAMLHGEQQSFYAKGKFLVMLYIIFHLHELKEMNA